MVNNFWQFLDRQISRLPGWPSEKQAVMLATYLMGFTMLIMARDDMKLWTVELFKTLITVVIVTGCINMVLAFYFTANKGDEDAKHNTGKAFEAITATAIAAGGNTDPNTIREGDSVVLEKK